MFQLKEIEEAHAKVKSGADFPRYVQALINIGVIKYNTFVKDGHTVYFGNESFQIQSGPKYKRLNIANISDKERFKHHLKSHQRGQIDFPAFCNRSAETGVEKWSVDMHLMTCTYFDKKDYKILEEEISTP